MADLNSKMELLTSQYSKALEEIKKYSTLKIKLEGAIEVVHQLMEDEKVSENGATEKVKSGAKKTVKEAK